MNEIASTTLSRPQSRGARITAVLGARLAPEHFEVIDDSARHAGHAGAAAAGETHYSVTLVTSAFAGMSRVQRARLVQDALAEEFATGLHALALNLRTPGEWAVQSVSPG